MCFFVVYYYEKFNGKMLSSLNKIFLLKRNKSAKLQPHTQVIIFQSHFNDDNPMCHIVKCFQRNNLNLFRRESLSFSQRQFTQTIQTNWFLFAKRISILSSFNYDFHLLVFVYYFKIYKSVSIFFSILLLSSIMINKDCFNFLNRKKPTFSKKQKKVLAERRDYLQGHIKNKKV